MENKGFTLVELVVTIVLFSIASAAFFTFFLFNSRTNQKLEKKVKMYETLHNEIEAFKTTVGNDPTTYSTIWSAVQGTPVYSANDTVSNYNITTVFYLDSSTGTSPGVSPNNIYLKAVVYLGNDSLAQHFIMTLRR